MINDLFSTELRDYGVVEWRVGREGIWIGCLEIFAVYLFICQLAITLQGYHANVSKLQRSNQTVFKVI